MTAGPDQPQQGSTGEDQAGTKKTFGQRVKGIPLHTQILVALVIGALAGPLLGPVAVNIKFLSNAFINLLVMVVVPLIMASLIIGTASLGDLRKLGRIGLKTVTFYLGATAIAVALGLGAGLLLGPGTGMDPNLFDPLAGQIAERRADMFLGKHVVPGPERPSAVPTRWIGEDRLDVHRILGPGQTGNGQNSQQRRDRC